LREFLKSLKKVTEAEMADVEIDWKLEEDDDVMMYHTMEEALIISYDKSKL
jgi:hypothetical protein